MKLQYLGDIRDAFQWDLLHSICTRTSFSKLVFVPLLTPDVEGLNEGQIHHHRFACQDFIRPFLESLKEEPRSLNRVASLGTISRQKRFEVSVFAPDRVIGSGESRSGYWVDFKPSTLENAVVFFDPDNGFEPVGQYERGKPLKPHWIGHDELKNIFAVLPETSVAVVYQHRPRRTWADLFSDLAKNLNYVHTAVAAHESTLAFVTLAGNAAAGKEISSAIEEYADKHPTVGFTLISMNDSTLGSNSEFEKFLSERDLLRAQLGELSAERENSLHTEGPNLHSIYYQKVGHLEVSCLKLELECARIKREIELITAAVNTGSAWDYEKITTQLDQEFEEWQQRIAKEVKALDEAKARLANLMKPEDSAKIQKLYRLLVKELHPDVQPTRHPRLRPLWDRLQRAYQHSDIAEMELIELLIRDEQAVAPPSSLEELHKEIEYLKTKCKSLVDALFKIRQTFPFTLGDLLSDPVGLAEKQKALEEKLHPLEQRRTALLAHLNALLDSRP